MASGRSLDFDYGNRAFSDPFADFSAMLDGEKNEFFGRIFC
jgi:hypothetical protein